MLDEGPAGPDLRIGHAIVQVPDISKTQELKLDTRTLAVIRCSPARDLCQTVRHPHHDGSRSGCSGMICGVTGLGTCQYQGASFVLSMEPEKGGKRRNQWGIKHSKLIV